LMDAASKCALRAGALTHRLLAFGRRQALDIKPNDVNRVITSMEELLRRTLGERIELVCKLSGELWSAFTESNQLESALLNLAINSRDAMPDGGQLTIQTENVCLDEAYTSLHEGLRPGDYVSVTVSDEGIGMSPEVLEKALDPFFTTKPVGEGTGLGLSVIYGFIKQSHGHLHISSEMGRGTSVTLYLPRARQSAIVLKPAEIVIPRGHGETVLVVEDDSTVRSIISDALQDLGYKVLTAPDARVAIPLLQSTQPIDLLISDVILPHINGGKLAQIARRSPPAESAFCLRVYGKRDRARDL
jgi:Histidine kinase-, DNA gyrase B-, and HSP90-like ATPase/Response regulator receiver domain